VAQVIRAHRDPVDSDFRDGVLASLKSLRAFALSLTRDLSRAEDLVQETVLRAITHQESFETGTNLQAWLFTILRNLFLSAKRRTQREVEDADGAFVATLIALPDQEERIVAQDLDGALAMLPLEQREAILLIGAEGLSYEETADRAARTLRAQVSSAGSMEPESARHIGRFTG
jgi:RNA polymerase sigma-70 factor (ECF subfamily)